MEPGFLVGEVAGKEVEKGWAEVVVVSWWKVRRASDKFRHYLLVEHLKRPLLTGVLRAVKYGVSVFPLIPCDGVEAAKKGC